NNNYNVTDKRKDWWNTNKQHVWNVMMCYYNENGTTNNTCESHDNIDETPQFLRWLTEWSQQFCNEEKKEGKKFLETCQNKFEGAISVDNYRNIYCDKVLNQYKNWYAKRKEQWDGLKEKYKAYKQNNSSLGNTESLPEKAEEYVKQKCDKCNCDINNLEKMYEKIKDSDINTIKTIVKYVKTKTIPVLEPKNENDPIKAIENLVSNVSKFAPVVLNQLHRNPKDLAEKLLETTARYILDIASKAYETVKEIKQQIEQHNSQPPVSPTPAPVPHPPSEPIPPSTPTTSSPEMIVGPAVGAVAATILGIMLYK
ncbi:putative EMP1-like protein, partial [Plasmodium gaboni]